jgi:hypothetical protein
VPGAPLLQPQNGHGDREGEKSKRSRTRAKKKGDNTVGEEDGRPITVNVPDLVTVIEAEVPVPETPAFEGLDPIAKKIRNLSKKVRSSSTLS